VSASCSKTVQFVVRTLSLCQCAAGVRAAAECMAKSRCVETQECACRLLRTLAEGNPKFQTQVYRGLIALLACSSAKAQHVAARSLRVVQVNNIYYRTLVRRRIARRTEFVDQLQRRKVKRIGLAVYRFLCSTFHGDNFVCVEYVSHSRQNSTVTCMCHVRSTDRTALSTDPSTAQQSIDRAARSIAAHAVIAIDRSRCAIG